MFLGPPNDQLIELRPRQKSEHRKRNEGSGLLSGTWPMPFQFPRVVKCRCEFAQHLAIVAQRKTSPQEHSPFSASQPPTENANHLVLHHQHTRGIQYLIPQKMSDQPDLWSEHRVHRLQAAHRSATPRLPSVN
jgi:hypothetical protein